MKTRIQLTIRDDDKDSLEETVNDMIHDIFYSEIGDKYNFSMQVFDNEPEAEPEIEILYPS